MLVHLIDHLMWPCGEMASRLTTITRHQEIAGSTPVSVNLKAGVMLRFLNSSDRPTFIFPRRGAVVRVHQFGAPDTLEKTRKVIPELFCYEAGHSWDTEKR